MKTKQRMQMEVKGLTEEGAFDGILSMYGNVDLGRDMVEPGAFTKTMKERGDEIPLLWQHKQEMPIGKLRLIDGPDALRVEGQLEMGVQKAQEAYLLMKAGIVKGLSIGFDTIRDVMDNGVRRLKELRLWEGSVVTFPMNEACQILAVKAQKAAKGSFEEELAENQLSAAGSMMLDALRSSLSSIVWSSAMTTDEAAAAAQLSIQQFSDAYLAYLPNYLSYISSAYGGMKEFQAACSERKTGRMISASNKKKLRSAHEHMKSASELIYPLIDNDADPESFADPDNDGDGITSKSQSAGNPKPAPVPDHSAIDAFLDQLKALTTKPN